MLGLSPAHLIIILVIALIVIGPGKLPEVGAAIGKSIKEFQKATGGITDTLTGTAPTAAPPAPGAQVPMAQVQPPAQSYYAAAPAYPAPAYPVMVAPVPMQYPVMGVVEPAPALPTPALPTPVGDPQPDAAVRQPPTSAKVD